MIVLSLTEFAAQRRGDQDTMEKDLYPEVSEALQVYPATNWYGDLLAEVTRLYIDLYHREGGQGRPPGVDDFVREVRDTLEKTENPTDATADRISTWLATAILNAATIDATADDEEFLLMEWVTMRDEDVRPDHRAAHGQQRPPGETFDVCNQDLRYPGDPTASLDCWMNCRCALAPTFPEGDTFRKNEGVTMTATDTQPDTGVPAALAWHGVLAPEGVWSGDGRRFAENALRFRDLPLPLTWQKATEQGHDGSVVVGKISSIERVDGLMRATGTFLATPEADEVVGLIAEFGKFGVSVDADDAEFELSDDDGKVTFTSARIASASVVSIPAFAEAFIALGPGEEVPSDERDVCNPDSPDYDEAMCREKGEFKDYTPKQRKDAHTVPGSDGAYPIEDCEDLKNAIQAIGRAKDPAAVKRHIKSQKSRLGCPEVSIPEGWADEADPFREAREAAQQIAYATNTTNSSSTHVRFDAGWWDERGKGWLTHPEETRRIHNYWTKKGQEGYAKIGWGTPGDFNRCRVLVGEKIAENSPEDMVYLNQICAQWHHDALGIYPGEHRAAADTDGAPGSVGEGVSLVASAETIKAPAGWFADPHLTGPTHLTITEEGRVFGHLAEWETCHIGYDGVCVAPPTSASDYAYYATGRVLLDDGSVARTGVISLGGGHATERMRPKAAMHHYDSTSTAVADVCVGEDDYGIWCSGWVRPGVTDQQIVALRASDVSGDWRDIHGTGELELVAALAVNVGGFPVKVGVESGVQVSLVAAGMLRTDHEVGDAIAALADRIEKELAARDQRRVQMREIATRGERRERMKTLAARVKGE